jgi:hypothetical protein
MIANILAKLSVYAVIAALITAAFFYVKNLQSTLELAKMDLIRIEEVVERQTLLIDELKESTRLIQIIQNELFEQFNEIDQNIEDSSDRLRSELGGELEAVANRNPAQVVEIINRTTSDSIRCNQLVTGSPLTPDERAGTVTNSVCPEILGLRR